MADTAAIANEATITLSRKFTVVFAAVALLTALGMILSCSMIFAGVEMTPGSEQAGLLQALTSAWKMGFGAMLGMLGAKAT
jgi:hypothetical protein